MARQMKYPIGVQDFESLRQDGFVYVDKTKFVMDLVETGRVLFLSRPRRFGKSLLLSTFKAYFEGKRELFKGLAIDTDEVDWTPCPVLHLDLNTSEYKSREQVETILRDHLNKWEEVYGSTSRESDLPLRFKGIIESAHQRTGRRVVVLVDEYDKPLLQCIGNEALMEDFRSLLKSFYGVLKSADAHVRFALITGVTKFSKVSIFSDLNNLNDISLDVEYADICGITEEELFTQLSDGIEKFAQVRKMTVEDCRAEMKRRYDGYHFTEDTDRSGIYNPFSVLSALSKCTFRDYWFATGTPSFLIKVIKQNNYRLDELMNNPSVTSDIMGQLNSFNSTPLPILYQSGYLTIKGFDERFNSYTLGFPNYEVEYGFFNYLATTYTRDQSNDMTPSPFFVEKFIEDIENGRAEDFMQRLDTFFVDSSYQIIGDAEKYFQNVMFVVFKMLGFYVIPERHTSRGRIDIMLQAPKYVFIIELKLDGTIEEALQQIEDKEYAKPFQLDGRTIIKIGANFSSETRHLTDWKVT